MIWRRCVFAVAILALLAVMMWTIPMVAVFAMFAIPAGALVGLGLILSRHVPGNSIISLDVWHQRKRNESTDETPPPPFPQCARSFDRDERFRTLFELRYHPVGGDFPDKGLRTQIFKELWPALQTGVLDGFALRDHVMKSKTLTLDQRVELFKDIMALAQAADRD